MVRRRLAAPTCWLTDVRMPEMSGTAFARAVEEAIDPGSHDHPDVR